MPPILASWSTSRPPATQGQHHRATVTPRKKGHGTWAIRQELVPPPDGERRTFRRSGFGTADEAQAALDQVRALLSIAEVDDAEGREAISALLAEVAANKDPIPDYDETKRRLHSGQDLNNKTTVGEWLGV